MRAQALITFAGVLGLAALAASAPAPSYFEAPDNCVAGSTATVYVTIEAGSQAPTTTVYVTVPSSRVVLTLTDLPTTTSTRFVTRYRTTTSPKVNTVQTITEQVSAGGISSAAGKLSTPLYDFTVTETTVVTISNVNLTPISSGGSVTYSGTPAPDGIFYYVVENDTTIWLDGQTPAPSESYVYATTSITVLPVYITPSAPEETSTLTLQSTIYTTSQLTLTETLGAPSSSGILGVVTSASVGNGLSYPGMGPGGWNSTSTAHGIFGSGATKSITASTLTTNNVTLVTDFPTFNIYETRHSTISASYLAAQSGFNAITTSAAGPSIEASSARGEWTTAIISGHTISWGVASASLSATSTLSTQSMYVLSSIDSLYFNSTSATVVSTKSVSSAVGPVTSLTSSTLLPAYVSSSGGVNSTSAASSSSLATSTITGPVPLGSPCTSSSQCTNGVGCYAVNSMLIPVCSNFQAPCTSDAQCAFNTCASGFCTGVKYFSSSSSSTSGSDNISTSTSIYSSSSIPSSVVSSKSSTSVSSTPSATPSLCGEYGDFILDFDDIPPLSIGNQSVNSVQPEPVFNPYHQFYFSDGYTVVPPPTDPYLPSSPPLLLEFIPNFTVTGNDTQAGSNTADGGFAGQISDGDADQTGCFRFNMYGASFGCDSQGPDCDFTFSGYRFDTSRNEIQVASQGIAIPACPPLANCSLTSITLDHTFQDLTFVRINLTVNLQPKIWWMDDLRLGWFNNSCATGLCRQSAHLH